MTNNKASWLLTFSKQCVVGPMCGFSASHHCSAFSSVKSRRTTGRVLASSLIIFLVCVSRAHAVDELVPPFGFRWNDSMARVEAVLHGAKAKITSREKKQNRDVWTVEGLLHPGFKSTLFTFKQSSLVTVEQHSDYTE